MSWNDERVELLKKLWADGLSASQIAGQIGGVTRNAVIGKVHRLGLSGRATTTRSASSRPRTRITTSRRPARPRYQTAGNVALRALYQPEAEPYVADVEEMEIPVDERKSLQDLEECSCRWPIGDPQTADFHFCNQNKMAGLPYCEFHARRAFQPPQSRRRTSIEAPVAPAAIPAPGKVSAQQTTTTASTDKKPSAEPVDA